MTAINIMPALYLGPPRASRVPSSSTRQPCAVKHTVNICFLGTSGAARPALRDARTRAIETIEFSADDEADTYFDTYTGHRREGGGYTPFEFITYSDIVLRHEVTQRVEAPVAKCFQIWADRFNWMQWFDMIEEVGFHEEDPNLVSMYIWYRWAQTPFLELFVTLERTDIEENKHIMEEPVGGAPIVAAVLFEEQGPEATLVKLRLSYQLPDVLCDFAGKLAVWGDVDRKVQASMTRMATFVEAVDLEELLAARKQDWQLVKEGFPENRQLREEDEREEDERLRQRMAAPNAPAETDPGQDAAGAEAEAASAGLDEEGIIDALAGDLGRQGGAEAAAVPEDGAGAFQRSPAAAWGPPEVQQQQPTAAQSPTDVQEGAGSSDAASQFDAMPAADAAGELSAGESSGEWDSPAAGVAAGGSSKGKKGKATADGEKKAKRGRPKKTAE